MTTVDEFIGASGGGIMVLETHKINGKRKYGNL